MCVCVRACMYTCVQVLPEARKGDRFPGAGATGVCEPHRAWYQEANAFTLRNFYRLWQGVVTATCLPSTWEAKAGGLWVRGQVKATYKSEGQSGLCNKTLCQKNKIKTYHLFYSLNSLSPSKSNILLIFISVGLSFSCPHFLQTQFFLVANSC